MTTTIPAAPDTWLVTLDDRNLPLPVIGWLCSGDSQRAFPSMPVVPCAAVALSCGHAVRFPDHTTVDIATGKVFADIESWRADVEEDAPYEAGDPIGGQTPTPAPKASRTVAAPSVDLSTLPVLDFSGKVYKNKSFWRVETEGDAPFVFTLDPETPAPLDDFVSKITRDEFFQDRKIFPEHSTADLLASAQAAFERDQGQLPLGDDEDDDIGGLV